MSNVIKSNQNRGCKKKSTVNLRNIRQSYRMWKLCNEIFPVCVCLCVCFNENSFKAATEAVATSFTWGVCCCCYSHGCVYHFFGALYKHIPKHKCGFSSITYDV